MSRGTIVTGGRVAAAFDADLSILYVGKKQASAMTSTMNMSRMKLSEWEIEHPGVKVLEYAELVLSDMDLLQVNEAGEIVEKHALKPDINGAYELHAIGKHGQNIRLRLREGEIIDQVIDEVDVGGYDVAIIGASKERRLAHRLIQFVNCSLFITKNIRDITYKFLFAVDGTELSRKALLLGARTAGFLKAEATLLTVVEGESNIESGEACLKKAEKVLKRAGIPYLKKVLIGDIVETVIEEAGDDNIVVMGSSKSSQLSKFFKATKAVKVVQDGNCPVLIAK
ncbi:MAG: universal stress protein [Candidatus Marinimicrobia bacterium]|nr:universal stress protein [Candidatus Neomarinimicrobiota bacterium]